MNVLIRNAKVVDGTGNPWFWGDVEAADGRIRRIDRSLPVKAKRTIDAQGLVVAPGFIDPQCHNDGAFVFRPAMENCVTQGITSSVFGKCGEAPFPDKETWLDFFSRCYYRRGWGYPYTKEFEQARGEWNSLIGYLWGSSYFYIKEFEETSGDWHSLTEFCQLVTSQRPAINAIPFVGLTTILWKAGYRVTDKAGARKIAAQETAKVKELVRQGLEEGAVGLSAWRDSFPGACLDTEDYLEPVRIVADYRRVFHLHASGVATPAGISEAITIARKTGVKLHISHLNTMPSSMRANASPLSECLDAIDAARRDGLDITFDVIQKREHCLGPDTLIPNFRWWCLRYADKPLRGMESLERFRENLRDPAYREEVKETVMECAGRVQQYLGTLFAEHLGSVVLVRTGNSRYEGKTLDRIAEEEDANPRNLFFELGFGTSPILATCPNTVMVLPSGGGHVAEADIVRATHHQLGMPSSDLPVESVPPEHFYSTVPYATMPHYYRKALEHGVRMEESVRKMTSFPAQELGIRDRGVIREGMRADIVVLDPARFRPAADASNPWAKAEGINYVMVNGVLVLDNGKVTGERPGEVLLRGIG